MPNGTLVAPKTAGTLKFDYTATPPTTGSTGNFCLSTTVSIQQTTEDPYGAKDFGTLTAKSGVTVPDLLKALAFFPNSDKTDRGYFYMRNKGERLLLRGGHSGNGGDAGEALGNFDHPRSISNVPVGLFSAYVDPALYA